MNSDPVDAIMHVMKQAFDPAFGEAWTRRQVADALMFANTHYLLAGDWPEHAGHADGEEPVAAELTHGFALSRQAADEEELLLLAVIPSQRGKGLGRQLVSDFLAQAQARGSQNIFLEMRDGNPAEHLYRSFGFEQIGRRKDYYRGAAHGPIDAVTFGKSL